MLDNLHHGRECYVRHLWTEAYQALLSADQISSLAADDLECLAIAAYLIGRNLEFQRCIERLHRLHVEASDSQSAARCAFWLALSFMFQGRVGQVNAWIARGQRQIGNSDCAERGYLLVPVAEQQLLSGNADITYTIASDAAVIGERFKDADLTAVARHLQGRARIRQGKVPAGLALLDETMLAVVVGELSPIMAGLMYCSVIDACRQVYAVGRAREWTSSFSNVCEQEPQMLAFTGTCLVPRAEIMRFLGAWPEALAEVRRACERCEQSGDKPPAEALYQKAEIHRLRGEFTQAEKLYRSASQLGLEPQPGIALLRLVQGHADTACTAICRLMTATTEQSQRARLLPVYLGMMLASGDIEQARSACQELQRLADIFDSDALRAAAAQAQGAIALAEGDAWVALAPLRSAFDLWQRLEAPYEAARVRVLIGQVCRLLGDEEAATLEFDAAKTAFEQLGAQPDLARVGASHNAASARNEHPLTTRERDVLHLIATGCTNKAIAAELHLSERTIDRHVSNILGKLDVPSRAAATAYAYEHQLF